MYLEIDQETSGRKDIQEIAVIGQRADAVCVEDTIDISPRRADIGDKLEKVGMDGGFPTIEVKDVAGSVLRQEGIGCFQQG
jgi:hypothetical protein